MTLFKCWDLVLRDLEDFAGIASDWFWETDANHRFTYFSPRMKEITQIEPSTILGKRRDQLEMQTSEDSDLTEHLDDLANLRPFRNFEYKTKRTLTDEYLWLRVSGEPVFASDGTFQGYRGSCHDLSTEKEALEKLAASYKAMEDRNKELNAARRELELAAFEDPLTGLRNRRAFDAAIEKALLGVDRQIALLHIDLDRFKWVNDTLGHPAGDMVLVTAAGRIQLLCDYSSEVYRVGGDEFILIMKDCDDMAKAVDVGKKIVAQMSRPMTYENHQFNIGASVGVAISGRIPTSPHRLIAHADAALYAAKREGRNCVRQTTTALQTATEDRRQLSTDISKAIQNSEFIPYFQLQWNARTEQFIGAEALVRWQHPQRGLLSPADFLEPAAEMGLIHKIDAIMLEKAIEAAARLKKAGCCLPALSINTSQARLLDPDFPVDVQQLWTDPEINLSFELLETIDFDDDCELEIVRHNLERLREIGVGIETDDFGSGRASITGLLYISPDRLKIDRRLVRAAGTSTKQYSLLKAIIDMATSLDIDCIAEGVETQTDIRTLQDLGCHSFQGYAISHPLGEADLLSFLETCGCTFSRAS